ncbi:MAG: T9SS type A sorting domain-containing protein [Bacteroidales bacterium]|nr:T9SS type A sorting domain-containing protein [Bacteroidales bacterium]MCF8402486.1 T9SS type A sorting domain-containing protein [Bacteroidales bacterium]
MNITNIAAIQHLNISGRRIILSITFMVVILFANAQSFSEKNRIYLIGQITSNINGAPLKDHQVIITSDTTFEPSFNYLKKLFTDHEGYYYDTIVTDHQKGALKIYTFDYQGNYHDTIVHYRFNWSEDIVLFANLKIPVEPAAVIYQANFYFQKDPNGTNYLEYQFYDITNSVDVISGIWDFGDNATSNLQNPGHTYSEPGLYRVKLTVYIKSSLFHNPIQTTIVKIINVTAKNYFHMGGHVMAGYFPIDKGEAYLYKIEDKNYVAIDTAEFNGDLGFYYFYQLLEGEYLVKADLHHTSELYNQFMSTYYSNKLHWEEADTIFHYSTNFDYDIELVPNNQVLAGPGNISGEVSFGSDPKSINPACYVELILYDSDNHPMDICHSDENGQFSLPNLDLQMYYLYAEVTGKYTVPLFIELDQTNPEIDYVKITIGDYGVYGSISSGIENSLVSSASNIFPNPALSEININVKANIHSDLNYTVYNQQGITEIYGKISPDILSAWNLNISDLPSGLYYLRINSDSEEIVRRFIKK